MSRRCAISGKGVLYGHNVSHANNKTQKRFLPNVQSRRLLSDALGEMVRIRVTPHAVRTIEKHGGLDAYLLASPDGALSDEARRLKRRIAKAAERHAAA
jgi:large subunit ribosomal protein L28